MLAVLLFAGAACADALSTGVAANGDVTVQNGEFKAVFYRSHGGQLGALYDLGNDPAKDIAAYLGQWSSNVGGKTSYNSNDPAARLVLEESIGARAKVAQGGGFYLSGNYNDLNSDSTFTVYPGNSGNPWKIYMQHAFTNVGTTGGADYTTVINFLGVVLGATYGKYTDNDDTTPDEDDWWFQITRDDISPPKKNTSVSLGYYNAGMYNNEWNPSSWKSQTTSS
ncbi:hypothetical protein KJ891_02630, partial [Candidatus Micrarchaeota archaeon]|nr:hypothetical protein [Candidatus Micrarchaeota archaeon]